MIILLGISSTLDFAHFFYRLGFGVILRTDILASMLITIWIPIKKVSKLFTAFSLAIIMMQIVFFNIDDSRITLVIKALFFAITIILYLQLHREKEV